MCREHLKKCACHPISFVPLLLSCHVMNDPSFFCYPPHRRIAVRCRQIRKEGLKNFIAGTSFSSQVLSFIIPICICIPLQIWRRLLNEWCQEIRTSALLFICYSVLSCISLCPFFFVLYPLSFMLARHTDTVETTSSLVLNSKLVARKLLCAMSIRDQRKIETDSHYHSLTLCIHAPSCSELSPPFF